MPSRIRACLAFRSLGRREEPFGESRKPLEGPSEPCNVYDVDPDHADNDAPPSTTKTCPVIIEAPDEVMKSTASATS